MEDQFGQQRKKFMNLMIQKDTELSTVRKSVEQYSIQARQLSQQLMLQEEEVRVVYIYHRFSHPELCTDTERGCSQQGHRVC